MLVPRFTLLTLTVALLAAGCDSSDDGTDPSENDDPSSGEEDVSPPPDVPGGGGDEPASLSRGGAIELTERLDDGTAVARGLFLAFDGEGVATADFYASVAVDPDTCTVGPVDGTADATDTFVPEAFAQGDGRAVSAGDVVTVTGPDGSYAELVRRTEGVDVRYATETGTIPRPVPDALMLDVPGDEFPAFAEVSAADILAFELLAPAPDASITPDTVFSWTPSDSPDTFVRIEADDGRTALACQAEDDGEFTLPEAVRAELGESFSAVPSTLGRSGANISLEGDAMLYVIRFSGYGNGDAPPPRTP